MSFHQFLLVFISMCILSSGCATFPAQEKPVDVLASISFADLKIFRIEKISRQNYDLGVKYYRKGNCRASYLHLAESYRLYQNEANFSALANFSTKKACRDYLYNIVMPESHTKTKIIFK